MNENKKEIINSNENNLTIGKNEIKWGFNQD